MTSPLTLPLWKDLRAHQISGPSSSMDSWLGPTRRGTMDKQLSPTGSGPGGVGSPWSGGACVRSQSRDKQEAGRKSRTQCQDTRLEGWWAGTVAVEAKPQYGCVPLRGLGQAPSLILHPLCQ